jgi:hypothetical protein
MCKPSKAMEKLNDNVQAFTKQVVSEAGTVFGAANSVFNNIMSSVTGIVNGGPSQAGYSANELSAKTAANVEAGGTMARNLRGAVASAAGAIGGGNTVMPSGTTQAAIQAADIAAAKQTAQGENAIVQGDWETGRQNFWKALGEEQAAPGVYSVADAYNRNAGSQLKTAQTSQQNIDTQKNWWKPIVMQVGLSALVGPSALNQKKSSDSSSSSSGPDSQMQPGGDTSGGGGGEMGDFGGGGGVGGGMDSFAGAGGGASYG